MANSVSFLDWTLIFAPNWQFSYFNYVDLAATLMIFGFVTLADIKLHLPSSKIRSAINQAIIHLIFVGEVGKLGGGMWL